MAAITLGNFVCRLEPVRLHLGCAAIEQARGFGRMRGENRRLLARRQRNLQIALAGDQVERIGVEHQRLVEADRSFKQFGGIRRHAETGAAGQRRQLGEQ